MKKGRVGDFDFPGEPSKPAPEIEIKSFTLKDVERILTRMEQAGQSGEVSIMFQKGKMVRIMTKIVENPE